MDGNFDRGIFNIKREVDMTGLSSGMQLLLKQPLTKSARIIMIMAEKLYWITKFILSVQKEPIGNTRFVIFMTKDFLFYLEYFNL
jgi:hypothetical protein